MIRILPENLVNKIAAGEVIVRPASVVKELVENAIDAGATRIVIELSNGCRNIRVRDDGCGIAREELPLALLRHATSKIEKFEDLWQLRTRGFRGEALASIAAVARLTILSRARGELAGARLESEPGRDPVVEAAGAPQGTEVFVRDLFFNTPVRLKFLKSPTSELQFILYMVTRQALIRPDIGFVVLSDKQTLMELAAPQPWRDRVVALIGMEAADHLLEVRASRQTIQVHGFVATPALTRRDRRYQFFFVNSRPITSRSLSNLLQQAYRGLLMTQRFAVAVLDVQVPPHEVDVNVHPTKEEVRFRDESVVFGTVFRAVQSCLTQANLIPQASLESHVAPVPEVHPQAARGCKAPLQTAPAMPGDFLRWTMPGAAPTESHAAAEIKQHVAAHQELHAISSVPARAERPVTEAIEATKEPVCDFARSEHESLTSEPMAPGLDVLFSGGSYPEPLGQVADCYIVARCGDNLLLIDQHAAHERLLYMKFRQRLHQPVPTQPLLIPLTVDVPPAIVPSLLELAPHCESLGLRIEHFGGNTFVVQSVPADLPNLDTAGLLADLADDLEEFAQQPNQLDVLRDRLVIRMACRAAIKAGQQLQIDEMRQLIHELVDSHMGFTCPHGRPTMILLTRHQLDRQFKRIV